MLSKNQISRIASLHLKKYREEHGEFIAEGEKLVLDILSGKMKTKSIYASAGWTESHPDLIRSGRVEIINITVREMERISALSAPGPVLSVVAIPEPESFSPALFHGSSSLVLMLDEIRDPGNLGTMIRIADWFGIGAVICSEHCVDLYNPKVVQSTMGSVARVKVFYQDLPCLLADLDTEIPVYGTFLEGENIYTTGLGSTGIILIGNESKGISENLLPFVKKRLKIPSFSPRGGAESLNASIAAAVVCAEFRRRSIT